ncbi:MAG: A/G-specific adenine glycosylase [Planctomycetota bacterium]|nr:MAG: A/G-specific adenine glycosylase [Planctomycetota bacterium]
MHPPFPTSLARRLLAWYRRSARPLPWRVDRDSYRVWISEIMLQQTQVATVEAYFARFMAAFPSVAHLAAAPEADVLRLWEGLGYYRRARQLHRAAKQIVAEHGGEFPSDGDAVRRLPGIGRYTAGAVLSIAFDRREPILEANTVRLLSRLVAFRGNPHDAAGQKHLWQVAAAILPKRSPGEFNQALMELGSQVCTPREPRCDACPLEMLCPTRAAGLQAAIPPPKTKPRIESVRHAAIVIRRGPRVLLVERQEGERWAGLWDFPRIALGGEQGAALDRRIVEALQADLGMSIGEPELLSTLRHSVTRFRITLECYAAEFLGQRKHAGPGVGKWFSPAEISMLPLNTTGRKISRLLPDGLGQLKHRPRAAIG